MIRVMLVDDHALFRQCLRRILSVEQDIQIVTEAGAYDQAVEALQAHDIGVVVVDISMPGRNGIDLITHIKSLDQGHSILALSMHEDVEHTARALRAGAIGYMVKTAGASDLVAAVRRVADGSRFVCPSIAEKMAPCEVNGDAELAPHMAISDLEFHIFELLVQSQSVAQIAASLSMSAQAVSEHKAALLEKLGCSDQGELTRYAHEHGLVLH